MPDWNALLVPADAAEFWTAASAVSTTLAVWFAYRSARAAWRALDFEHTPVVMMEREGDVGLLRNTGRGVATGVLLTEDDGGFVMAASAIASGASTQVGADLLRNIDGFNIYTTDVRGRWFRTKAVYNGLDWDDGTGLTNQFRGRVSRSRVPRVARRKLADLQQSNWEYVTAVSSNFTWLGWKVRFRSWCTWARIDVPRFLEEGAERRRTMRFGVRLDRAISEDPIQAGDPPIHLSGEAHCWKGARTFRQLMAQWEEDTLIAIVEVRSEVPRPIRGVVAISRAAFDRLPSDKRDALIQKRVGRYICRLRPRQPFVYWLRAWGPFLRDR